MNLTAVGLDVARIRAEFPILNLDVRGKRLVYLDNAATSQKPRVVLDAIRKYYENQNANVHRGVHYLSEVATSAYEGARRRVARHLHARNENEIVFVRGTTEAINLVASSFVRPRLRTGDEILITHLEHHSNIVPWQMLCTETGAVLKVAPIDDRGDVVVEAFEALISPRTRFIAVNHISNALGTVNPVARFVAMAHAAEVPILIDGAQAVPHQNVDVAALGCDFYVFSGHKVYAPTGIGALYGRRERLEAMPPWQGGGDMIRSVTFAGSTFADPPQRFEAGTPNIEGAVGLAAALDFVAEVGVETIGAHEASLLAYGTDVLQLVPGLRLIGTAREKAGVLSFVLEGVHPHDIGTILDHDGIAIRTGHHCAQPVMDRFGVPATARASLAMYNTTEELDRLAAGLVRVAEMFR